MASKRISAEMKEEAISKVRSGRSVKEVAAEYGIDSKNIYNWLHRSADSSDKATLEISRLKRENEALMRLIGRLTYEQDMAKKIGLVNESAEVVEKQLSKAEISRKLGISRSSLYYKHKRPSSDEALRQAIEAVMLKHPGYGHRRVADELQINRKRARRVMQLYRLKPARRCRSPKKPDDIGKEAVNFPDITRFISPIAPQRKCEMAIDLRKAERALPSSHFPRHAPRIFIDLSSSPHNYLIILSVNHGKPQFTGSLRRQRLGTKTGAVDQDEAKSKILAF